MIITAVLKLSTKLFLKSGLIGLSWFKWKFRKSNQTSLKVHLCQGLSALTLEAEAPTLQS